MSIGAPTARRRRPRSVTFVGALLCGEALLALLIATFETLSLFMAPNDGLSALADVERVAVELTQLQVPILAAADGVAALVAGIGLLRLQRWAWLLAMSIKGLTLAVLLRWYVLGTPLYGPMALSSLIVLVLNQREIRQTFESSDDAAR